MAQYIAKVAQLAMRSSLDAQQVENVFYLLNDNGWNDDDLRAVADAAATVWTSPSGVLSKQSAITVFQGASIRDLSGPTGKTFLSTIGIGQAGQTVQQPLPNNVAFCLHKNAVVGGRHAKGRTYHYGLVQPQTASTNVMGLAAANGIRDAYNALQNGIEEMPVVHMGFVAWREQNQPLNPPVFIPQTGFGYKDLVLDSQRRRLPGRGR